jgi:ABC-type nitrate/sulfonate/bicarbonate transport system permease component
MKFGAAILNVLKNNYSLLVVLVLYEALGALGLIPTRLLPSLTVIWAQFVKYMANGDLPFHAWVSLYRALIGFSLALMAGLVIGIALARSKLASALIEPVFTFGYPIPKIALYPIFIFIFGFGSESKIALVFLECVYPIVIYVSAGMRSTDKVLVWAARGMGASNVQIFWRVLLPAALPSIFTGVRIALPVALIITLVTEIIGESKGLGFFITFASASFEYARALAAFLLVAIIGFTMDRALGFARSKIVYWA